VSYAFMFCYSMRDKLNTTLLCFLYASNKQITFNALLFMIFCLCYFSCCNRVANSMVRIISFMPMFKSTLIPACNALHRLDQDCVGCMSPQKLFFVITYLLEDEQELSLGMLDTLQMYLYFLMLHACFL
jgi:hypothetical protein